MKKSIIWALVGVFIIGSIVTGGPFNFIDAIIVSVLSVEQSSTMINSQFS